MSVRIMSLVWDLSLSDSLKIVLLALADNANDEGLCWPSIATIAKKCSKGQRTIQLAIKSLVEMGHLTRHEVVGKGCKYYVHPRREFTPAENSPPQPATNTPAVPAPKPSRTTINKKDTKVSKKPKQIFDDWQPEQFGLKSKSRKIVDGWPPDKLEETIEHFISHHKANGTKSLDWQASWSTWVINSKKFEKRNGTADRTSVKTNGNPLSKAFGQMRSAGGQSVGSARKDDGEATGTIEVIGFEAAH